MTPEQLNELAEVLRFYATGAGRFSGERMESALQRAADYLRQCAKAEPICAYEWDTYSGGVHRSFSAFPWNGREPDRVVLLYTRPAPQPQPAQADALPPGWKRHEDGTVSLPPGAMGKAYVVQANGRQPVREPSETRLLDLLAVIHRDGGHYTDRVGIEASIEEAKRTFFALQAKERW